MKTGFEFQGKSQRGFSLIEVMITIGIVGILAAGSATLMEMQGHSSSEANFRANALVLKQNLNISIADSTAWANTVANNPSLACLSAHTCNETSGGSFNVYDTTNHLFMGYDANNPSAGFDINGKACTGFGGTTGNCVLHINFSWASGCNPAIAGSCSYPSQYITMDAKFKPAGTKLTLNTDLFSVQGVARMDLGLNNPVVNCALSNKIYIGVGHSFETHPADSSGCISMSDLSGGGTPVYTDVWDPPPPPVYIPVAGPTVTVEVPAPTAAPTAAPEPTYPSDRDGGDGDGDGGDGGG